jgi:DNA-binding LytR/AlgR family response regulator
MRILLADEDSGAIGHLQSVLADREGVEVVGSARDGGQVAGLIEALRPDMVFLDVQIPGRNGLPLARALTASGKVEVVFMASAAGIGRRNLPVPAGDLLLKPAEPAQVDRLIARARARNVAVPLPRSASTPVDALWAPGSTGLVRVDVDTIDWIEAARDYVLLHTASRSHIIRSTMSALERLLDPEQILRVSRSAFVQRRLIEALEQTAGGHVVRLAGGRMVRVGVTYGRVVEALGGKLS